MTTELEQKNILCAVAIHAGVDVLLNQTATDKQINDVCSNLSIIFKNIMPFLRGDKKAQDITQNATKIDEIFSLLPSSPINDFSKIIGEHLSLDSDTALFITIPSLCNAIYGEIEKTTPQEASPWFEAFCDIAGLICRGEPLKTVSAQLTFINDILNSFNNKSYLT